MDGLNFNLLNNVEVTSERCSIHEVEKVTVQGLAPFCTQCAAEDIQAKNQERSLKAAQRYHKRNTYDWLRERSIFSDESLRDATFDTYEEAEEETVINKRRARFIAKDYLDGKVFNTVMSGTPGAGKSHLSMAMLHAVNDFSEPYRKCLFVSVDELMRRIKDSFNNKNAKYTEQSLVELLTKADLLVLDDLGAETGAIGSEKGATDFTTRTLYAVMNGRMNKSTIITTNLSSTELKRMYDRKLLSRMYRGAEGHLLTFKNTSDKRVSIEF